MGAVGEQGHPGHAAGEVAGVGGVYHRAAEEAGHAGGGLAHDLQVAAGGAPLEGQGDGRPGQAPPAGAPHQQVHPAAQAARGAAAHQFPAHGHPHRAQGSLQHAVVVTAPVVAVLPHGGLVLVVGGEGAVGAGQHPGVEVVRSPGGDEGARDVSLVGACRLEHHLQDGPVKGARGGVHPGAEAHGGGEELGQDHHLAPLAEGLLHQQGGPFQVVLHPRQARGRLHRRDFHRVTLASPGWRRRRWRRGRRPRTSRSRRSASSSPAPIPSSSPGPWA